MKSRGVYARLSELVRGMKADETILIDAKEVKNRVLKDVDSEDFDLSELIDFFVGFLAAIVLNQERCYSLNRGEGIYVNLDACTEISRINKLADNKQVDIIADEKVLETIRQCARKFEARGVDPNQLCIDLSDPDKYRTAGTFEDAIRDALAM